LSKPKEESDLTSYQDVSPQVISIQRPSRQLAAVHQIISTIATCRYDTVCGISRNMQQINTANKITSRRFAYRLTGEPLKMKTNELTPDSKRLAYVLAGLGMS
jgi:hypothetical protein